MPDRDADDAAPFPATPPDGAGRPPAHDGDTLRRLLSRSFANSERMIARARPQDMEDSTPCSLFDVRALVGHMLFAAERVGAA
ncbi:MAG TPA: hypothetical protein VMD59_03265, partial [Acidimicrobiales bacterium]|nr:hypothetical protein [Acidimicrobiales bacterium]